MRDLWALRVQRLQERIEDRSESQESTLFSSQQEEPSEDDSQKEKAKDSPKLIETLCLCYLGASLLRLPLTVGDIISYVLILCYP